MRAFPSLGTVPYTALEGQPIMDSVPAGQPAESAEQKFQRLAAVRRAEMGHLSSTTKMFSHPAYQEIIAMGMDVVPWLLRDLAKEPEHWFAALRAITGAQPVPPKDRGQVDWMAEAWLAWANEHGYQW
jgi:hypothetical protein